MYPTFGEFTGGQSGSGYYTDVPLHEDMNAHRWANEFMHLLGYKSLACLNPQTSKTITLDEDLMLAWFSNAIMAGWDNARRRMRRQSYKLPFGWRLYKE